jgi:hypothetical protein
MKIFDKLCIPAKIYFAIAVICTIIVLLNGASIMYAFWQMVFAFIWTFVLGFLCNKGYTSISWLLVLLPYLLIAIYMFNIYQVIQEDDGTLLLLGLQGPYIREGKGSSSKSKRSKAINILDNLKKKSSCKPYERDIKDILSLIKDINVK